MSDSVTVLAPAKLNLVLAVGPRDADGFHPICSWMVTVGLFDELLVSRLEADRLSRYAILWHEEARRRSEINWSIIRDLAVRAHLAIEKHVGRSLPVQLKLEKRIPVGGGLGGGSSDAAAMLHAVNRLHALGLSLDELASLGGTIGSDVPYLVRGGSAIVEGRGERVEPHAESPTLHAVIVMPDFACSTAQVYAHYDGLDPRPLRPESVRDLPQRDQRTWSDALFNHLAASAMAVAPDLRELAARIAAIAERPVHVSGSGSSLFLLADDELHAEFLARAIEAQCDLPSVAVPAVPGRTGVSPSFT